MAIIRRSSSPSVLRTREWDPFEMMQELMRFEPWGDVGRPEQLVNYIPSFDVKEVKNAYLFKADLPGIKESDLDISLTGNRLTVSGKREEEKKDEGERYYAYERSYGSFSRSFTLPEGVDVEHVQADLKEGVLTVVVPKLPEVQPKKIAVKGISEKNGGKVKA